MATKRPIGSPQASEISSPPTAKRRGNAGIFDMIRPTNADQRTANFTSQNGKYMYMNHHSVASSHRTLSHERYLASLMITLWSRERIA